METTQQVVFKINNEEYGLNIADVLAIEPLGKVTPIPNSPSCVYGMTNLRGEVLSVISLRRKFGLEETENNEQTKIIVTSCNDTKVALKVDEVKDIVTCTEENVHPVPDLLNSEDTEYAQNVLKNQDRLILLINPNKLIGENVIELVRGDDQ